MLAKSASNGHSHHTNKVDGWPPKLNKWEVWSAGNSLVWENAHATEGGRVWNQPKCTIPSGKMFDMLRGEVKWKRLFLFSFFPSLFKDSKEKSRKYQGCFWRCQPLEAF